MSYRILIEYLVNGDVLYYAQVLEQKKKSIFGFVYSTIHKWSYIGCANFIHGVVEDTCLDIRYQKIGYSDIATAEKVVVIHRKHSKIAKGKTIDNIKYKYL